MWWRATDPLGRYVLASSMVNGEAYLIPLDGSPPRALGGFHPSFSAGGVALSPDARRAAVGAVGVDASGSPSILDPADEGVIRIWELETGQVRILRSGGKAGFDGIWFLPGERLVSSGPEGLFLWDLKTGTHEVLSTREHYNPGGLDAQGRYLVIDTPQGVTLWDLEKRSERILPIPFDETTALAISPNARFIVAGRSDGEVWVLQLDEKEPHVLLGHEGWVGALWISPESDRICSAANDGTVRIWAVPKGVVLHTLPLPKLLDALRAQTNMRVVLDPKAPDGYRIKYDRFPGWEKAPIW